MTESNVYIVTKGAYSDYQIVGVFSTEKLAQDFIDKSQYDTDVDYEYLAKIETYPLDNTNEWGYLTTVFMNYDGDSDTHGPAFCHLPEAQVGHGLVKWPMLGRPYLSASLLADSKERAVKIANEIRTGLIASGEWERDELHSTEERKGVSDVVVVHMKRDGTAVFKSTEQRQRKQFNSYLSVLYDGVCYLIAEIPTSSIYYGVKRTNDIRNEMIENGQWPENDRALKSDVIFRPR